MSFRHVSKLRLTSHRMKRSGQVLHVLPCPGLALLGQFPMSMTAATSGIVDKSPQVFLIRSILPSVFDKLYTLWMLCRDLVAFCEVVMAKLDRSGLEMNSFSACHMTHPTKNICREPLNQSRLHVNKDSTGVCSLVTSRQSRE